MLKYVSCLICFLSIALSPLVAQTSLEAKKYYCSSKQIEIAESAIFVHEGENILAVDCIGVDQEGIYFTKTGFESITCQKKINPKNICEYSLALSPKLIITTPDQIIISSEGMFVAKEGALLGVHSIMEAEHGYLVVVPKSCPDCGDDGNQCPGGC